MTSRLRFILFSLFTAFSVSVYADGTSDEFPCGMVNYGQGVDALYQMTVTILAYMYYVDLIIFQVAALLSVYSATNIYIKLQNGEDGFVKSVMTLVFSMIFLIASTSVLPAFFGVTRGTTDLGDIWTVSGVSNN